MTARALALLFFASCTPSLTKEQAYRVVVTHQEVRTGGNFQDPMKPEGSGQNDLTCTNGTARSRFSYTPPDYEATIDYYQCSIGLGRLNGEITEASIEMNSPRITGSGNVDYEDEDGGAAGYCELEAYYQNYSTANGIVAALAGMACDFRIYEDLTCNSSAPDPLGICSAMPVD